MRPKDHIIPKMIMDKLGGFFRIYERNASDATSKKFFLKDFFHGKDYYLDLDAFVQDSLITSSAGKIFLTSVLVLPEIILWSSLTASCAI